MKSDATPRSDTVASDEIVYDEIVYDAIQPIDDIAAAYKGRIILHPRLLNLPRAQQLFWYTHECAHQIFGPGEAAADCWAVQQGRVQGWLTRAELDRLGASMRDFPGDATHSDGRGRVVSMEKCFTN